MCKKIFLIGGTGFVGRKLLSSLLNSDYQVLCLEHKSVITLTDKNLKTIRFVISLRLYLMMSTMLSTVAVIRILRNQQRKFKVLVK